MTLLLAIIADDLTGALDAAAPFSNVTGGACVATSPAAVTQALLRGPGVLAVSTRSRDLPANQAACQVSQVLAMLPASVRLFKKVDSRMKGNIEAEIEPFAVAEILCAPGLPEFGRFVKSGVMSGFGIDHVVDVAAILGKQAARSTICDTASAQDLDCALQMISRQALLVGARSLAAALARSMDLKSPSIELPLMKPACVAIGSTDPITCRQVTALQAQQPAPVHISAPAGECPEPQNKAAITEALTILQATDGESRSSLHVARVFANSATPYLMDARTIVLSGGATAEAVLDTLKCTVLSLKGEALAGLPLCQSGAWTIVTKSGGFGHEDSLIRLFASNGASANPELTGTLS